MAAALRGSILAVVLNVLAGAMLAAPSNNMRGVGVHQSCDPPQGFECASHTSAPYWTIPGNVDNGAVSEGETALITSMQKFMKEHAVKLLYQMCGGTYVADHLLPLLHVLPGELVCDPTADYGHVLLPSILAGRVRQIQDADITPVTLLKKNKQKSNAPITIALSANWESFMTRRAAAPNFNLLDNVALSHGDDDDAFSRATINGTENKKVKARPFQDLFFSKYAEKYRYKDPVAVADYLNTRMAEAHKDAPCRQRQGGCRGTLLVATGFDDNFQGCQAMLGGFAMEWLVVLRVHPLMWEKRPEYPCFKVKHVFVDDPNMRISQLDILSKADAVVTDSGGTLGAALQEQLDLPIVRVISNAFQPQYASVKKFVFNESMGAVAFKDEDLKDALERAVQQMAPGSSKRDSAIAHRQDFLCRYLWKIDGLEEYRVAYQILVGAVPAGDFDDMRSKLEAVTDVPPRPAELLAASYPSGTASKEALDMNRLRMGNPKWGFNSKHSASACSAGARKMTSMDDGGADDSEATAAKEQE